MSRIIHPDSGRTRILRSRTRSEDALADAASSLAVALQREQQRRDEVVDQLRDAALQMALLLAERLLQERLTTDRTLVLNLAAPMLAALRRASSLTVYACPKDAERLRQALSTRTTTAPVIEVHDDAELTPGSLRIDSDMGSLDGRLQVRLARLANRLRTQLKETP